MLANENKKVTTAEKVQKEAIQKAKSQNEEEAHKDFVEDLLMEMFEGPR